MRKLATASLAFSAAVFLAVYLLPGRWLLPLAAVSAAGGAALALLRRRWLRPAVIALLFFALGLAEFSLYTRATVRRARELSGETLPLEATVLDYPEEYSGYCRLRVRVTGEGLPRFKAIVYDEEKCFSSVEPGDRLRFSAKLSPADTLFGKPYDNYLVSGYFLKLNMKGEGKLLGHGLTPESIPVRIRHALCTRVETLFDGDVRPFLKALMLGDKEEFYEDDALTVTMSRAGLMHIVAVSGLHIAFLVGLLMGILGHGRRGALTSLALVWCFVLITGGSNSALRAAVMQSFLLLAPLLRRENDPVTSLSAALALILIFNPLAARSVSLQLSFAAMAGILCFGERLYRFLARGMSKKGRRGLPGYLAGVLASTLSVMVFTVPLTAMHFSYVQLLAVLGNIACLWAVSLCFSAAWIACALSFLPLVGQLPVLVCSLLARYILLCARAVAAIPYSVLYMRTDGALLWMIASYALMLLGVLLRRRRGLRVWLPGGLSLALLAAVILHTRFFYRTHDMFTVLDVGQGQSVCAFAGEKTAVVDCGNTMTLENAGTITGEYLLSCGRSRIDVLLLTHLHEDHADGVLRLLELVPVETLILPAEADDGDALRARILASARRHGTEIVELDRSAEVLAGHLHMSIYHLPGGEKENERCLMATLTIGETDLLLTADSTQKTERALVRREDLSGTDILVVGHHGSKYASADELLDEVGGGLAVISTGYNLYGHPAPETLERLAAHGFTVYRTDRDGNVEIRAGENNG